MRNWLLKILKGCNIGKNVKIMPFTNLYGCVIDDGAFIGPFVEIQKDSYIGRNTRISSHSFICSNVKIDDDCFIGHGVCFINDIFSEKREEWIPRHTFIGKRVRIGSNATILPVSIADDAIIGAGAVVTKNVIHGQIVKGNPAK